MGIIMAWVLLLFCSKPSTSRAHCVAQRVRQMKESWSKWMKGTGILCSCLQHLILSPSDKYLWGRYLISGVSPNHQWPKEHNKSSQQLPFIGTRLFWGLLGMSWKLQREKDWGRGAYFVASKLCYDWLNRKSPKLAFRVEIASMIWHSRKKDELIPHGKAEMGHHTQSLFLLICLLTVLKC